MEVLRILSFSPFLKLKMGQLWWHSNESHPLNLNFSKEKIGDPVSHPSHFIKMQKLGYQVKELPLSGATQENRARASSRRN